METNINIHNRSVVHVDGIIIRFINDKKWNIWWDDNENNSLIGDMIIKEMIKLFGAYGIVLAAPITQPTFEVHLYINIYKQ